MPKLGIHSFAWSAGSSRAELETALTRTRPAGFELIELSYLDPKVVEIAWLARRLEELGLGVAISTGLPVDGDISSADSEVAKNGIAILDRAVALTRDLGGTKLGGILSSAHGYSPQAPTNGQWERSVAN